MADQEITRDDFTIEHSTAKWGGPTAKVTITRGPLAGRTFWLRSTQGLDNDITRDLSKGGGIHLDGADPDRSHHGWRGAFKTFDMNEAIDRLVDYVNDIAERERVQDATWSETAALSEAVQAFTDALNESSQLNFLREWQRVQEAVAALDMKIKENSRA